MKANPRLGGKFVKDSHRLVGGHHNFVKTTKFVKGHLGEAASMTKSERSFLKQNSKPAPTPPEPRSTQPEQPRANE